MKMKLKDIVSQLANRINQPHVIEVYLRQIYAKGFVEGTKQSPWISVEEQLPPCSDEDLFLLGIDSRGVKNIPDVGYMHSSKDGKPRKDLFVCGELVEVTHWMKVPSFEDILEANRDVLERMKEKGD